MEILGYAITGLLSFILAFLGLAMFTNMKLFGIGPMLKSVFGKATKIIGVIIFVIAIAGAIAYVQQGVSSLGGGELLQTGSLVGEEVVSAGITGLSCQFNSAPSALDATYHTDTAISGAYFVADTADLSNYKVYIEAVNGTRSVNGTISCTRTGDIDKAGVAKCYAKASSFRSETSTTDSNTYYWVATSASASKVAGFPWQQTIYLQDGAVATTSSDKEMTDLVFVGGSSAEAQEDLGYYLTLPGATPWSYLNNLTSGDVKFYCDYGAGDQQVAKLTITKVSA